LDFVLLSTQPRSKFVVFLEGDYQTYFVFEKKITMPVGVQNRHGKSNEAAANDTENAPEVSAAKGYDFIACKENVSS
jgi:hypothetical protein